MTSPVKFLVFTALVLHQILVGSAAIAEDSESEKLQEQRLGDQGFYNSPQQFPLPYAQAYPQQQPMLWQQAQLYQQAAGMGGYQYGGGAYGAQCSPTRFRCPGGECIPRWNLCDGRMDCRGGMDEQTCGGMRSSRYPQRFNRYCQLPTQFQCGNRNCLPRDTQCNGFNDCGDNTDEMGCGFGGGYGGMYGGGYGGGYGGANPYSQYGQYSYDPYGLTSAYPGYPSAGYPSAQISSQPAPGQPQPGGGGQPQLGLTCNAGEHVCYQLVGNNWITEKCLQEHQKCNGVQDCSDGSDESNCTSRGCNAQSDFTCKNGQCIPIKKKCDGHNDCIDHSDEQGCSGSSGRGRS